LWGLGLPDAVAGEGVCAAGGAAGGLAFEGVGNGEGEQCAVLLGVGAGV